jgi:hypothetical protein
LSGEDIERDELRAFHARQRRGGDELHAEAGGRRK